MDERRKILRVEYPAKSVIVLVETGDKYYVQTTNVSPLGMGIKASEDIPDILGKDVIVVAETMIMYADVNRQEKNDDGTYTIGIRARKFSTDVLEYLFERIGNEG